MLEKTHSASIDCEENAQNDVVMDAQWLCGLASVDETMFKSLWDTYISIRPAGTPLNSLSTWGKIVLANDATLKGKLYKTNDGYIVVSYSTSSPEDTEGTIKIGYATKLEYSELPFYMPSGQVVATPSQNASDSNSAKTPADKVSDSEEIYTDWEPQIIDGKLSIDLDN